MVYFFSISHLRLGRLPGGDLSLRRSHCPGVSSAAAWYLERGGPWRVRFIYGAHYTVDLFAVSNPALQAFLELTSMAGGHTWSALGATWWGLFVMHLSCV